MKRPDNIPEMIVETDTVAMARDATRWAIDLQYPVRVIGRPGTGKSSALWHIAQEFGGLYCEISQASKNTKGMLELLLQSADRWCGQQYVGQLADAVYSYFGEENYYPGNDVWRKPWPLLVIDEAQTLEPTAFRELLRVQEKCSLGMVLAGNAERLANTRKDADTWAQIESPIAMHRLLPGPSARDCELIGSTFNVEGRDAYSLLTSYGAVTNFRDLVQLLHTAKRMTGGVTGIRKPHLEQSLQILGVPKETLRTVLPKAA